MPAREHPLVARVMGHLFPRVPDFAGLMGDQCAVAVDALDAFLDLTVTAAPEHAARVRLLEKEGDRLRQRNVDVLNRSFATPFDRELTAEAIRALDDVLNYAKTAVREIEVLAVEPDQAMQDMARELRAGAVALRAAVGALGEGPEAVQANLQAVHKSERNVEKIYRSAIAELFPADGAAMLGPGPVERSVPAAFERLLDALRRREVYRHISNAADRLDAAGRTLGDIAVSSV